MIERRDLLACRGTMRTGSRSFFAASRLLPRRIRTPATALYAFCRGADDAVDLGDEDTAIAALHTRLDAVYAGRPVEMVDRALSAVVQAHEVPRALLDHLLEGFMWDVEGRRYEDLAGLIDYARRVAGSVGEMMALIMGVRAPIALTAASDLGCAMQLTNIARDVGDDAQAGRLYLPLDWLRDACIDPEAWLAAPSFNPAVADVVRRLLDEAERLYARAEPGFVFLPGRCRPAVRAAAGLYEAIGLEVARRRYDSVSSRAVVPSGRKLLVLARSLTSGRQTIWERIDDRIGWTLELFARIEDERKARGMRNGSMSCVGNDENRSRSTLSCMASTGLPNSRVASVERA